MGAPKRTLVVPDKQRADALPARHWPPVAHADVLVESEVRRDVVDGQRGAQWKSRGDQRCLLGRAVRLHRRRWSQQLALMRGSIPVCSMGLWGLWALFGLGLSYGRFALLERRRLGHETRETGLSVSSSHSVLVTICIFGNLIMHHTIATVAVEIRVVCWTKIGKDNRLPSQSPPTRNMKKAYLVSHCIHIAHVLILFLFFIIWPLGWTQCEARTKLSQCHVDI